MRIPVLLLLLLLQAPLLALNSYFCKPGDKLYVLAQSGLRLRQSPKTGAVLTALPYGSAVTFVSQGAEEQVFDTVENMSGHWLKVSFQGKEGYVFSQFLSFLPAPSANCHSMRDYLKEQFKPVGAVIEHKKSIANEIFETDTIQTYVYGNGFLAVYSSDHGYESYSDHVAFYNVSPEEVWLLAQACYKHELTSARERLNALKKGQPLSDDCQPDVSLDEINQLSLSQFNWDDAEGSEMDIDLLSCNCYEGISIQNLWYMVVFSFGGGC